MHKIASHLSKKYDVTILGSGTRNPPPLEEMPYKQKRINTLFHKGFLFYLEFNLRLFIYLFFRKVDIIYAVDLDTLLVAYGLNVFQRKKYVYDSHEYFTELPELQRRTFVQKVWQWIENMGVPKAITHITVNEELAKIFHDKHNVPFHVIKNTPIYTNETIIKKENVFVYQGALNEGRGLEELIGVMKYFPDYVLEIAGGGPIEQELQKLVHELKLENVLFHGMLKPKELRHMNSRAKLGFNLLLGESLNYYYSLANKFFDYTMMGVPVITMNFPVYKRLMNDYRVGEMLGKLEEVELRSKIESVLNDKEVYEKLVENCTKARLEWNWENETKELDRIFSSI